ncbi:MAG: type II secretion system F family protein [Planctomycetes bacterium]|nr:type II secretion system F family protein [Planctomycetota bacterium]
MSEYLRDYYDPWMYVLAGASLTLFVWSLYSIYQDLLSAMPGADSKRAQEFSSPLFRILINFARPLEHLIRPYAEKAERRFQETGQQSFFLVFHRKLAADLRAGGNPEGITADEFVGLILLSTFLGVLAGYVCFLMYPAQVLIFAFGMGGFLLPRVWLSDLIKHRRRSIRKSLPYALDLLTLAVEAGLDFTTALARIGERLGATPLATEFRILLQEIQMGKVRTDALRDMAERVSVYELTSVVSSLTQTDELGAPLGPVLRIQAEYIRVRRAQEAEEMAMKAPVKLLFPLIVFIFPTAFIMIFGPLALKYLL